MTYKGKPISQDDLDQAHHLRGCMPGTPELSHMYGLFGKLLDALDYEKSIRAESENILGIPQYTKSKGEIIGEIVRHVQVGGCTCRAGDDFCAKCYEEAENRFQLYNISAILKERATLQNDLAKCRSARQADRECDAEDYRIVCSERDTALEACRPWIRRAWEAQSKAKKLRNELHEMRQENGQ